MPRTVLQNAIVIDGTGTDPSQSDVTVEDGRIVDIGRGLDADDAIDLSGRWLLPGMIDCHVHVVLSTINVMKIMQTPFSLNFFLAAQNLERTLQSGVTSVRDAGGADLGIKRAVQMGLVQGPRMTISIQMLSQTGGHGDSWFLCGAQMPFFLAHPGRPDGVCDGPDQVLKRVREVIRAGADVVKICTTGGVLSPDDEPTSSQFLVPEIETIVAEAAASGLFVMSHAQGANGIKNALKAGVRSIEHGIYIDDEAIEMMIEKKAFLVPTLIAPLGVLEAPDGVPEASLRKARDVVDVHRESIARAAAAGVQIAMGTDSGVTAHGRNLEELVQMVEIGMSEMDAIVASTRVAAENLGVADRRGTIEPGKDADLITLTEDPLTNIKVFADPHNIQDVWLGGLHVKGEDAE